MAQIIFLNKYFYQFYSDLYTNITLGCVREYRNNCRERVEHKLETEKAYINTIHEDFVKEMRFSFDIKTIINLNYCLNLELKIQVM